MPEVNDISLVQLQPVIHCRISRVRTHEPEKLRYFADLGLVPGIAFELRFRAPFNGPFRIHNGQEEIVLGYDLAEALFVETLEDAS